MITHETVTNTLRGVFPANPDQPGDNGLYLVARYRDPALGLQRRRACFFIPDTHLLSREDAGAYSHYHFTQEVDLSQLLEVLCELKNSNRGDIDVFQLGDLFDVWRARGGLGDREEVDEITADFADIMVRLREEPPDGLRAEVFAGNHDYCLHRLREWSLPRFRILRHQGPTGGDVLVLHGDVFTWLERVLPDDLQAAVVRLARWVNSGSHPLKPLDKDMVAAANRALRTGDRPVGQAKAPLGALLHDSAAPPADEYNVVDGDRGRRKLKVKKHFAAARELANELKHQGHDIRVVVMGHSHWARLIKGDRGDGTPFVLMDCGAWFGNCHFDDPNNSLRSAQVGVLIEDDLRIYQLGWRQA